MIALLCTLQEAVNLTVIANDSLCARVFERYPPVGGIRMIMGGQHPLGKFPGLVDLTTTVSRVY